MGLLYNPIFISFTEPQTTPSPAHGHSGSPTPSPTSTVRVCMCVCVNWTEGERDLTCGRGVGEGMVGLCVYLKMAGENVFGINMVCV